MLGKLLSDTYNKVRVKATEVREQVSQVGKNYSLSFIQRCVTAQELSDVLESQAKAIRNISMLKDTFREWVRLIGESNQKSCPRYIDDSLPCPYDIYKSTPKNNAINSPPQTEENVSFDTCASDDGVSCSTSKNSQTHDKEAWHAIGSTESKLDHQSQTQCIETSDSLLRNVVPLLAHASKNASEFKNHFPTGLSFRQVFLKSNALEIALKSISLFENDKKDLIGPLEEEEVTTPKAWFYMLLKCSLYGDQKLHKNFIYLLFCLVHNSSQSKYQCVIEIIRILKFDWRTEYLNEVAQISQKKIKEQFMKIQKILFSPVNELPSTTEKDSSGHSHSSQLNICVMATRDIIELAYCAQAASQQATERQRCLLENKTDKLKKVFKELQERAKNFENYKYLAEERLQKVEKEQNHISVNLSEQIKEEKSEFEKVSKELLKLQAERDALQQDLDRVSLEIQAKESIHKKCLERITNHKNSLNDKQELYDIKINNEKNLKLATDQTKKDIQSLCTISQESLNVIQSAYNPSITSFTSAAAEMKEKQDTSILHYLTAQHKRFDYYGSVLNAYTSKLHNSEVVDDMSDSENQKAADRQKSITKIQEMACRKNVALTMHQIENYWLEFKRTLDFITMHEPCIIRLYEKEKAKISSSGKNINSDELDVESKTTDLKCVNVMLSIHLIYQNIRETSSPYLQQLATISSATRSNQTGVVEPDSDLVQKEEAKRRASGVVSRICEKERSSGSENRTAEGEANATKFEVNEADASTTECIDNTSI